jgi:hypothetical protein
MLTDMGYAVVEAASTEEALRLLGAASHPMSRSPTTSCQA